MFKSRPSLALITSLAVLSGIILLTGASQDYSLEDRIVSLDERVASMEQELATLKTQLTRNHPDQRTETAAVRSLAAINAMLAGGQAAQAKPALARFMDEYGNTKAGARARSMAQDLVAVGKPVPTDWQVENWYQGGPADLASSGTTVLVFWETWCPHCRKAMPALQTVYDKYQGKGLGIVGFTKLSRGSTDQAVKDFVSENNIRFPMAKETGSLSSYFGVNGIPSAAVIKDGMIIWSGHPAAINDGMLQAWLADTAS